MLLSVLLTGGILYSGVNWYRERRPKQKLLVKKARTIPQSPKHQLQKKLSESSERPIDRKQKILNRNIVISGVTLGLLPLGALIYPPMTFIVGVPVVLYTCKQIFQKAFHKLKQKRIIGADALVVLTVLGGLVYGYIYLCLFIMIVFSLAEKFLLKVHNDSHGKLVNVFQQVPNFVWILVGDVELNIPFQDLKVGDIVVVHAGEVIPADGTIANGMANVDQHILTGEARPIEKEIGDQVFASTTVLSGQIHLKVEKAGEATTVAKIGEILNNTIEFKTSTELRAEIIADKITIPTLLAGGVAFPLLGASAGMAVLSSHFQNKMRMIASLGILNYLNIAAKNNILIKDGRSLEFLKQVDTIIFDKTGTLTEDQPTVGLIHSCADYHEDDILRYAVAAEYKQTHPIAKAIIQEADKRALLIPNIDETEYQVGYGLTVRVDDKILRVGSKRFIETINIPIPATIRDVENTCYREGHSLVMVAVNEQLIGAIELQPTIRPEAKEIIQQLRQRSQIKATYIISGDHEIPTRKLAQKLGIDHYFAETLPEDKAKIIERLQQEGKFVCYIGDGINDAIALKKSQVSISLSGASTVATDTAQILLLDQGLKQLNLLFDVAENFNQNMDTTIALVVTPTIIGIGGVFLLNLGIAHIIFLNFFALFSGMGNAMLPLLYDPSKKMGTESMKSSMIDKNTSPKKL